MTNRTTKPNKIIEKIALEVVTLEQGDILAMGRLLKSCKELNKSVKALKHPSISDITQGLQTYLEKLILEEVDDYSVFEEGIAELQSIYRAFKNKDSFKKDISPLLEKLNPTAKAPQTSDQQPKADQGIASPKEETVSEHLSGGIAEEDKEIITDFIMEARDNLGSIEVCLIALEQNPNDLETINSVFRPIHTIKGISGFLNLTKINRLAHSTEELLDKARAAEIVLESTSIDLILEVVDALKKLINDLHAELEGRTANDHKLDIEQLISQIEGMSIQDDKRLGQILVRKGVVLPNDIHHALYRQAEEPDKKIGEILVEDERAASKEVVSALREQKKVSKSVELQVKVDTYKLDNLVDLMGELVIAQAILKQNPVILAIKDPKLDQNINHLSQITSGVQRTAMSMRMVHIKNTFQRTVRVIRDLAKDLGKEVNLIMSGEDTEIDRNVVEALYEPMVHMIRNAVDHRIEFPEEREKAGKRRRGTISLRAFQLGGNIIIEILDDGRGLNKEKIIEKAVSKNIISDASGMTESEIYALIFQPGFSTAFEVTDISGRGVGMDVVKKNIEKHTYHS